MAISVAEDRSILVGQHQIVRTDWIDIDLCRLGNRTPMAPEAVQVKHQKLVNMGDCGSWPPIVGHWEGDRFTVCDGRHEYLASLMRGRTEIFVAWVEDRKR